MDYEKLFLQVREEYTLSKNKQCEYEDKIKQCVPKAGLFLQALPLHAVTELVDAARRLATVCYAINAVFQLLAFFPGSPGCFLSV